MVSVTVVIVVALLLLFRLFFLFFDSILALSERIFSLIFLIASSSSVRKLLFVHDNSLLFITRLVVAVVSSPFEWWPLLKCKLELIGKYLTLSPFQFLI